MKRKRKTKCKNCKCDGRPCVGDCDKCGYEDDEDTNVPDKPKNKVKRCFGIPIEFANRLLDETENGVSEDE